MAKDKITSVKLSKGTIPLKFAFSDAKALTGLPKPLKILVVEKTSVQGYDAMEFVYALRYGGKGQHAHAKELTPRVQGERPYLVTGPYTPDPALIRLPNFTLKPYCSNDTEEARDGPSLRSITWPPILLLRNPLNNCLPA